MSGEGRRWPDGSLTVEQRAAAALDAGLAAAAYEQQVLADPEAVRRDLAGHDLTASIGHTSGASARLAVGAAATPQDEDAGPAPVTVHSAAEGE